MVMIIFKSAGQKPDGLELTLSAIGEETGRILLRDYTNQQEDLYLEAADFDDDVICRIALGAELEDYRFDKYAKLAPQDYPKLETITFKVKNPLEMRLKYEPYAALANAIRFARDLFNEPESLYQTEQYFFEIKRLEYLNLYFKDLGDGLEKFRHYATPRGYYMLESTYGVRVLIHHNKKSQCEAVDAVAEKTGEKGWIVNMANRQRKFVTEKGGYKVL